MNSAEAEGEGEGGQCSFIEDLDAKPAATWHQLCLHHLCTWLHPTRDTVYVHCREEGCTTQFEAVYGHSLIINPSLLPGDVSRNTSLEGELY